MVKQKFIIKGIVSGKRSQFTRDSFEDAKGIAKNFDSATILKKFNKGLGKIAKCKKGICKEVSIKERLRLARKFA